jgi:hypothetical protein
MSLFLSNDQMRLYSPGHKVANGFGSWVWLGRGAWPAKMQPVEVISIDRFADISQVISSFKLQMT